MDANEAISDSDLLLSITNRSVYGWADGAATQLEADKLFQVQTTLRPLSPASPPPPETRLSHDFTIH